MWPKRNINNELTGQIIDLVCEVWGVTRADLVCRSRKVPLPWARSQLCRYLTLMAGHDTISCGQILHRAPEGISTYFRLYERNRRKYTEFKEKDGVIYQRILEMKKGCKPGK